MQSNDDLAREITSLSPSEQQALIDKVARLNLQKGLHDLAEKYRSRLASEGRLNIPAEQVWAELHRIREEIAAHDYPA
jgi:predicted alpha/beta-hydrolase family hydrolase